MEHNGENENLPSTLCRTGCGFYASAAFEGMCSKCYKDSVKRRQQNSSPTPGCMTGRSSPSSTSVTTSDSVVTCSGVSSVPTSSVATAAASSSSADSAKSKGSVSPVLAGVDTSRTPDVDTATPTVPSASAQDKGNDNGASAEEKSPGAAATASGSDSPSDKDKKPKKNRCHSCKKKVGLTGFQCRCGGLYCSMHRYSDKHDCTFNYKELAQAQIRKNNPVVVGQKIQKI